MAMGFDKQRAAYGLLEAGGNVEKAIVMLTS